MAPVPGLCLLFRMKLDRRATRHLIARRDATRRDGNFDRTPIGFSVLSLPVRLVRFRTGMRDDANDANDDQTEPTLTMMMMDAIIDNERRRATTMEETPETEPPPETTRVNAEPMMRTRNPREAHAMGRPKRIVAGIEECARAYCDESARRMRLGKAYARVKRASTSTPSARCAMTLCAQLIEACDVRRGMIARACGKLGRHGRACAATLEAFAECNEWTAVELSGATTVDGRSCDAAAAIGATKRALAAMEREESRKLRRIVEGRMLERESESPPMTTTPTTAPPPPTRMDDADGKTTTSPPNMVETTTGVTLQDVKEKEANARADEDAQTRIRAPDDDCIIIDDVEDNDDEDDDYDDELVIPTTTCEREESPTPTIMTQPLSDDDSGDDAELLRNSLVSPRTKNVVEILMEMDLPRRERFQSISVTPSPEDDAPS